LEQRRFSQIIDSIVSSQAVASFGSLSVSRMAGFVIQCSYLLTAIEDALSPTQRSYNQPDSHNTSQSFLDVKAEAKEYRRHNR
jgi:hypothetical protein